MSTPTPHLHPMALSPEEQSFFIALGARITALRKAHRITQVQLAQTLGVSQQTITAYETGRRRIQVSVLPVIAQALRVSVEELIDGQPKTRKRGPTGKIQQQLEQVQQLPRAKQKLLSDVLESLLATASR